MAHREVIPTRSGRYGTRMLTAGEPVSVSGPMAREMIALGRAEEAPAKRARPVKVETPAVAPAPTDERPALRAAYEAKFGKKAFGGWSAELLREKLAAA